VLKSEETIGSQRLLGQTVVLVTIQVLQKLSVEDVSINPNALNGVYRTKDLVSGVALQGLT
jgi:hypothetical protein